MSELTVVSSAASALSSIRHKPSLVNVVASRDRPEVTELWTMVSSLGPTWLLTVSASVSLGICPSTYLPICSLCTCSIISVIKMVITRVIIVVVTRCKFWPDQSILLFELWADIAPVFKGWHNCLALREVQYWNIMIRVCVEEKGFQVSASSTERILRTLQREMLSE